VNKIKQKFVSLKFAVMHSLSWALCAIILYGQPIPVPYFILFDQFCRISMIRGICTKSYCTRWPELPGSWGTVHFYYWFPCYLREHCEFVYQCKNVLHRLQITWTPVCKHHCNIVSCGWKRAKKGEIWILCNVVTFLLAIFTPHVKFVWYSQKNSLQL